MGRAQRGDVHLGNRPRQGPRLSRAHTAESEGLGGALGQPQPRLRPGPATSLASHGLSPPQDQVSKDKALQSMASMSSAQIVSASVLQNKFSPPSPLPQAVFSTSSRVQGAWEVGVR